ncbi:MAG: hypothetical protein JWQ94_1495, partial [Tardiphaga sp.]|nr:hypothetical protein [Tardiphaga sp.]
WNTGGYEYPVFWALTAAVVAMQAWKVALQKPAAADAPAAVKLAA